MQPRHYMDRQHFNRTQNGAAQTIELFMPPGDTRGYDVLLRCFQIRVGRGKLDPFERAPFRHRVIITAMQQTNTRRIQRFSPPQTVALNSHHGMRRHQVTLTFTSILEHFLCHQRSSTLAKPININPRPLPIYVIAVMITTMPQYLPSTRRILNAEAV